MKVENKTAETKEFPPITIEITFESIDEIKGFWHRMNISNKTVRDGSDDIFDDGIVIGHSTTDIYNEVNHICVERGYKKYD